MKRLLLLAVVLVFGSSVYGQHSHGYDDYCNASDGIGQIKSLNL